MKSDPLMRRIDDMSMRILRACDEDGVTDPVVSFSALMTAMAVVQVHTNEIPDESAVRLISQTVAMMIEDMRKSNESQESAS